MSELKSLLEEKRKLVDKKATEFRQVRDDWNDQTKEHLGTRNNLNSEVRELITNVRTQRDLREQKRSAKRSRFAVIVEILYVQLRPSWHCYAAMRAHPSMRAKVAEDVAVVRRRRQFTVCRESEIGLRKNT